MTPSKSGKDTLLYLCGRAATGQHEGKRSISEGRLRPWIEQEAARLVDRDTYYREGEEHDDGPQVAAIAALRAAGEEAMADDLAAKLEAERAERGERERIDQDVPDRIDWVRWDAEGINRALRSLWERVELGADLLPVRAEWRVEGWRA